MMLSCLDSVIISLKKAFHRNAKIRMPAQQLVMKGMNESILNHWTEIEKICELKKIRGLEGKVINQKIQSIGLKMGIAPK